jgi:predicted chitinase
MAVDEARGRAAVQGWRQTVDTAWNAQLAAAGGGGITLDQLRAIMPNLPPAKAQQYLPLINQAMAEAHIDTPQKQAAFLAQIAHESVELTYMEEIASGAAYEGRGDLGNTQPGDGKRFKGRGPIQLTGRNNYTAAGRDLHLDLVNHPEIAATPEAGFRTTAWYWTHSPRGDLNIPAQRGDFVTVTKGVNGGTTGLASRQKYYARAKHALGIG